MECGDKDLHSGVFGGSVHEAMTDLITLMGEFKHVFMSRTIKCRSVGGLGVFIQGCVQVACKYLGFSVSNPEHFHVVRPCTTLPPHITTMVTKPLPMFIMCPPRLPGGQEGEDPGAGYVQGRG